MAERPDLIGNYRRASWPATDAPDSEGLSRPDAERRVRAALEALAETHGLRVLPAGRLGDAAAADFLVQIEDYELRLVVEAAVDGRPQLTAERVEAYHHLLHQNPAAVAILVLWPTPDLQALVLRLDRLAALQQHPELLAEEAARAGPLEPTLRTFLEEQTRDWGIGELDRVGGRSAVLSDTRTLFERELRLRLAQEAKRSYRLPEKVAAARELSERDVAIMLRILDLALAGEHAKELAARLVSPAEGRRP